MLLFLIPLSLNAQLEDETILNLTKKTGKLKLKASSAINDGDYLLAQLYLKELVVRKPDNTNFQFELGKVYYINREYVLAAEHLNKAIINQDEAYLYLSASKIRLGQYESAEIDYKTLRKKLSYKDLGDRQKQIYASIREDIEFYNGKKEIPLCFIDKQAEVTRLPELLNGKMTEFSPLLLDETTLFFGSTLPDNLNFYQKESEVNEPPRRNYFTAEKLDKQWSNPQAFQFENVDNSQMDYGGACFNKEKDVMYLTICERIEFEFECHLYKSTKKNDTWSEPTMIEGRINADGYNSIQPFMTYDTLLSTEVLYFSSNKKGSRGYDLWHAIWDEEQNKFVGISRCGNVINTSANEYAPFYINDQRILYFSSDGHGGYGGLDIMRAEGIGSEWDNLGKLPQPINSMADDVYFYYDDISESGFFSSNRVGVNKVSGKTCCEDLFSFKFEEKIEEELLDTSLLIQDAMVSVPVLLEIEDLKDDEVITIIEIYKSVDGKLELVSEETLHESAFKKDLANKSNYRLVFKKEGYLTTSKDLDLSIYAKQFTDTVKVDLDLIPDKEVVIPGINFEFDSDKLTPKSLSILDDKIYRLLIDNPNINIRLSAHTDNKGSDIYNLNLSEDRARSVVKYLISKGIDENRLLSKGFGETVPIAPNSNPDGSDNPEGRAKNRRVAFEII